MLGEIGRYRGKQNKGSKEKSPCWFVILFCFIFLLIMNPPSALETVM
jgi:hypothetical protein